MIIYAVVANIYSEEGGGWSYLEYDKFFKTHEKADLRLTKMNKKNKDKNTNYSILPIEVGE